MALNFAGETHTSTRRHQEFLGSCTSCKARRQAHHNTYVSDPRLDTRTYTCVHRCVQAAPTQTLYRHVLVEWVFSTSLKSDCGVWTAMCELLQMLPAQLLMALQTATASEMFYGQVKSHESVPLCSCRFLSSTPTDGKDAHEFPLPNGHPPPRPPLQWLAVGLDTCPVVVWTSSMSAQRWPPTKSVLY